MSKERWDGSKIFFSVSLHVTISVCLVLIDLLPVLDTLNAIQYRNTAQSDWQIMSTQSISGVLTGLNSKKSETTQENTEKLSETDKQ